MRSTSIGITAGSRSICSDGRAGCAGFTLIEALVAMTLLLVFVSVLGPYLFHARRIADGIDGRIAAQALLRTILDAPLDRSSLAQGPRSGETGDLHWTVTAEPIFVDAMVAPTGPLTLVATSKPADPALKRASWVAFHLTAAVSWAPGRMVRADTLRLGPDVDQ
jgi:prepilin-type N-terminal cleavage/methylation domain-containing protein